MIQRGWPQEHGGEVLEKQSDGRGDVLGLQVAGVPMLLGAPHRCRDDVHAELPELVLHGGEPLLGRAELGDGHHDADVLLEHVPVTGDHRFEKPGVLWRLRQLHVQSGRNEHVV